MKQQNSSANLLNGKTYALFLTIIILIIGTFFYFTAINNSGKMDAKSQKLIDNSQEQMKSSDNSIPEINTKNSESSSEITQNSNSLFNHILQENRIFTKKNAGGFIKLFYYYTKNEQMEIQLKEGNINDYEIHTIGGQNYYPLILGAEEAKTMRQEGIFTDIGDPIKDFFGKNVVIVGVMKETDSALDTFHLIPLNSGELN